MYITVQVLEYYCTVDRTVLASYSRFNHGSFRLADDDDGWVVKSSSSYGWLVGIGKVALAYWM
jgi:hypothetical protein